MLLVFTNKSAIVGPGLNIDITPEEKKRLRTAVRWIKTEVILDFGTTVVMAEFPKQEMASAIFIAHEVLKCEFNGFVRLEDFIKETEKLHKNQAIETLIVCCLSFAPDRTYHEAFYPEFFRWWNERCHLFGIQMISPHTRDGDGSVLLIDYENREARWLMDIGISTASTTVL